MQDTSIVPFCFHLIDFTTISQETNRDTFSLLDMQEATA